MSALEEGGSERSQEVGWGEHDRTCMFWKRLAHACRGMTDDEFGTMKPFSSMCLRGKILQCICIEVKPATSLQIDESYCQQQSGIQDR